MNRFFLPPEHFSQEVIHFPDEVSGQICKVLRLRAGEKVVALDNCGNEALVELDEVSPHETSGRVMERKKASGEPAIQLEMLICLTQREKFEWILQKGTELGVTRFVPVISSRSLVQKREEISGKMERWQRILKEAAEQSRRGRIPLLEPAQKLEESLPDDRDILKLVLWEEEKQSSLRQVLQKNELVRNISLLIGPEGGLSGQEVDQARKQGFIPVSLGRRILRMETAAITAAALVMYEYGEMDQISD